MFCHRFCFACACSVSANNVDSNESSDLLTSDSFDGLWVNDSLEVAGSTTLNPQNELGSV